MERSGIVSIFENHVYTLYICGNWCSKLHTFWLLLHLRALVDFFSEIFKLFQKKSMSTLYICGNWCSKLHTFWLLLDLRTLIDFFRNFRTFQNFFFLWVPFIFAEIGVANCILFDYCWIFHSFAPAFNPRRVTP